jgi:hypothetical protein
LPNSFNENKKNENNGTEKSNKESIWSQELVSTIMESIVLVKDTSLHYDKLSIEPMQQVFEDASTSQNKALKKEYLCKDCIDWFPRGSSYRSHRRVQYEF